MSVRTRLISALSLALLGSPIAAGCDDAPELPPPEDTQSTPDTTPSPDTVPDGPDPDCTIEPTLSSLQANYFQPQCVICHGPNAGSFGNLDLRPDGLHGRIVGQLAVNQRARADGKRLVAAGDAEASFLYQKVHGSHDRRTEGDLMPPSVFEPFDPGCSIYMLKKWIDDGALDN